MLRIRVLPVSVCLALSALPRGAVPDLHSVMVGSLELGQAVPMGTKSLTKALPISTP